MILGSVPVLHVSARFTHASKDAAASSALGDQSGTGEYVGEEVHEAEKSHTYNGLCA